MNDEKEDENPWDDDNAGRTLATASPSFDSHIPLPITVPPPADVPAAPPAPTIPRAVGASGAVRPMNPGNKPMPKATLVGLNPADYIKAFPRAGSQPRLNAQGNAAVAPRFPTPTPAPSSVSGSQRVRGHDDHDDEDDAPTMLGVRGPSDALGDSDLPPRGSVHDKFAETMALDADDDSLPDLSPREDIDEATKVGAHAHELHRLQDAHVVVEQGAAGDDATLAIPSAAAAELGLLPRPDARSLGPPLPPQTPPQPPVQHQPAPQTPRFPPPQPPVNALDQTLMAHEQWQQPPWQPPPQQQQQQLPPQPPPWQQSMAPVPYAQPIPQSQPFPPQGWAPQPSMTPYNPPPPPPAPAPGFQFTPQILILAGVGVVCLAIFIIGIVLFVTTKF